MKFPRFDHLCFPLREHKTRYRENFLTQLEFVHTCLIVFFFSSPLILSQLFVRGSFFYIMKALLSFANWLTWIYMYVHRVAAAKSLLHMRKAICLFKAFFTISTTWHSSPLISFECLTIGRDVFRSKRCCASKLGLKLSADPYPMKGFGKWECGTKFARWENCFLSSIDSRYEWEYKKSNREAETGIAGALCCEQCNKKILQKYFYSEKNVLFYIFHLMNNFSKFFFNKASTVEE